MSIYLLKSILACALLLAGLAAAVSMLVSMGRPEKKASPAALRKIHRTAGYLFALLLLILAVLGARITVRAGDSLSLRAVFHGVLALFLLFLFLLKIVLVRFYRSFLRLVPGLGMAVLVLVFVVFSVSAGYLGLRKAFGAGSSPSCPRTVLPGGEVGRGGSLFSAHCTSCHYTDRQETKIGPGLKGLFQDGRVLLSGREVTEDSVRQQLVKPFRSMPSFATLNKQDIADLIAYLRTL